MIIPLCEKWNILSRSPRSPFRSCCHPLAMDIWFFFTDLQTSVIILTNDHQVLKPNSFSQTITKVVKPNSFSQTITKVLKLNSWTCNFIEVSGHDLDSFSTWGFTDTWMWKLGLRPRNSQKINTVHKWDFRCSVGLYQYDDEEVIDRVFHPEPVMVNVYGD